MSQANVTVTRTVTTSSPNAIILNTGYLKTVSGILKILELILGGIAIGIIVHNYQYHTAYLSASGRYYYSNYLAYLNFVPQTLWLLLAATTFFILTACLLLACIFSLSTGGLISKTLYEFVYHLFGFIFLLITSLLLLLKTKEYGQFRQLDWYLTTSIICLVNSILYLISTILAFREYRN